jgi:hypothetical protein
LYEQKEKNPPKKYLKKKKKRHGAQINFGDLPPYLIYRCMFLLCFGNAINDERFKGREIGKSYFWPDLK